MGAIVNVDHARGLNPEWRPQGFCSASEAVLTVIATWSSHLCCAGGENLEGRVEKLNGNEGEPLFVEGWQPETLCDLISLIWQIAALYFKTLFGCSEPLPTEILEPVALPPKLLAPISVEREREFQAALAYDHPEGLFGATLNLMRPEEPYHPLCEALNDGNDFALPNVGHYGPEGYDMAMDQLIIKLPQNQLAAFPREIGEALRESEKDLLLMVLNDSCMTERGGKRNLVFHKWCYPDIAYGESRNQSLPIGLFQGENVTPGARNSVAFNSFASQSVYVHPVGNAMALSPDNMTFNVTPGAPVSAFFTAIKQQERALAAYCILVHTPEEGRVMANTLKGCRSLDDLKARIEDVPFLSEGMKTNVRHLLTYHSQ